MKIIFARETFHDAMQTLQSIAGSKNALPILANVLLNAGEDGIEMTATDLQVGVRIRVEGSVEGTGALTLPARKLAELARELPNEDVRMEMTGSNQVQIECGRVTYRMFGMAADDFPNLPTLGDSFFTINAGVAQELMEKTRFAASTEETRYFLNGVYLHLSSEWIRAVATDSMRLALITHEAEGLADKERGVIVPIKAVDEIIKAFDADDELRVAVQDNQIIFDSDGKTLTSRLMDGEYPAYSQIIPKDNPIHMDADREAFLNAIRRVSLFSDPQTLLIRLDVKETACVLSASTPDFGEAREEIDVTCGEPIVIGFKARFLMDALAAADSETVRLDFKQPLSAAVMRQADDDSYLCLIMPMRIEA